MTCVVAPLLLINVRFATMVAPELQGRERLGAIASNLAQGGFPVAALLFTAVFCTATCIVETRRALRGVVRADSERLSALIATVVTCIASVMVVILRS
jgi:hypothetical protein